MELLGFSPNCVRATFILGNILPEYTSPLKSQLKFTTENTPTPTHEVYAKQIGPINPKGIPFVTDKSSYSLIQGAKKRVVPQTPTPDSKYLKQVRYTVDTLLKEMEPLEYMPWDKEFIRKFLEVFDKPQKTKDALEEAYFDAIQRPMKPSDYYLKTFGKKEFYEDEKYVRCIMVRENSVKALMSWAIHQCDEYLFHKSKISRYFIKGMTPQQQVEAMNERFKGHSLFLETDYSSFESSFDLRYQRIVEIAFFKHMLKNNPHILEIVLNCYKKHKVLGRGFSMEFTGGRMSGDLWTSSMNGFSNLVNIMTLCRMHHLEWDGFCEGDDGLFWLSGADLTEEDYTRLGFTIKMEYKHRIQDCSFCGKVFDETSLHVLGTPEQLNRIGWSLDKSYWNAKPHIKTQLILSRALSLAVLYPGCPCIQARAKGLLSSAKGQLKFTKNILREKYQLRELLKYHRELDLRKIYDALEFPEPTTQDRILYEERFGITVNQQLSYELQCLNDPWADLPLENSDIHTGGKNNDAMTIKLKCTALHV